MCGKDRAQRHFVFDAKCGGVFTVWCTKYKFHFFCAKGERATVVTGTAIVRRAFIVNYNIVHVQNFRGKAELCIKNGMQRSHAIRIIPCVKV